MIVSGRHTPSAHVGHCVTHILHATTLTPMLAYTSTSQSNNARAHESPTRTKNNLLRLYGYDKFRGPHAPALAPAVAHAVARALPRTLAPALARGLVRAARARPARAPAAQAPAMAADEAAGGPSGPHPHRRHRSLTSRCTSPRASSGRCPAPFRRGAVAHRTSGGNGSISRDCIARGGCARGRCYAGRSAIASQPCRNDRRSGSAQGPDAVPGNPG